MNMVFPMAAAPSKTLWTLGLLAALMLVLTLLFAYLAHSARNARFEVTPTGLRLVGDLWGRTVAWEAIDVAGARHLDLRAAREYRPRRRTFGTGLPGYSSGWFRLRNGEKALAYLTDRSRVVYLPTREGYSMLLSVREPQAFLDAVKAAPPE